MHQHHLAGLPAMRIAVHWRSVTWCQCRTTPFWMQLVFVAHWRMLPTPPDVQRPSIPAVLMPFLVLAGGFCARARATRRLAQPGRQPALRPLFLGTPQQTLALSHAPLASAFSPLLQLFSPQNLAIKTPSPRSQLHRKRNTFGLEPARRVHFPWISNIRPSLPCALAEPSPIVMTRMPTATKIAEEKMAKGPARDSGGLCLYRKHHDFLNPRPSICLCFTNRR